jgi:hypothetical protein
MGQSIGHLPEDFYAFINMDIWDFGKYLIQKKGDGSESVYKNIGYSTAICDFLRREDELMTELMNHKRSTSY